MDQPTAKALALPQESGEDVLTTVLREGAQSWRELLLDGRARGLTVDPTLATGDGALGLWAAVAKVFPATRAQRSWVHKTRTS